MKAFFEKYKIHFIAIGVFLAISYIYFLPSFNGKTNNMEDVRQSKLTTTEAVQYYEKEGEALGWTNQIFSGMPADLIYLGPAPNFYQTMSYISFAENTAFPFQNLLLCFIGFYIFLLCLRVDPLLALFGALAYGFMTFTFSSIEAAHVNKVYVMALMPAVVGGLYLIAKEKFIAGFVVFTYNFALQTYYFHYQITYYTLIILFCFGIYYFVKHILNKNFKAALLLALLPVIGGGLGVVSNLQRLVTTQEYSKNTMRGGSALSEHNAGEKHDGLERDYAFSWSYGIGETFTVLVPRLYGGSSQETVTEKSPIYKTFNSPQVLEQKWPLYHGAMPSTSGPVYFGAIIIFLFVLSFRLVKSDIKWVLIVITLLSFMMSWGKNLPMLNNFLFDYLPFYNKFRTPMMALSIAQVSVISLAILALKELFNQKINKEFLKKTVLPVFYVVGGLLVFLMLFGSSMVGTTGVNDDKYFGDNYGLIKSIQETRSHYVLTDSLRSLFFIIAALAVIWFYATEKLKKQTSILLIGSLMVIDLVGVDMRYLTWADFKYPTSGFEKPQPDQVDLDIMKDADPYYRVMDMSRDPFNTNDAAAFHKLVGGYHAAKLSRYQDLISEYIVPEVTRERALDMLNCKYIMGANRENNQRMYQKRETALGNAWFVNDIVTTMSDREEMDSLKNIDPAKQVVININNQTLQVSEDIAIEDPEESISLYSYHPDTLRYSYNSEFQRFVVFSEVYYNHWKLFVNGKETPIYKVNYTLRGAVLPPGKGNLEMVYTYKPAKVFFAETRYSSIFVLLMTFGWVIWGIIKGYKASNEKA
ncbi:MAG: YfhO family protein [Bacteroidia bacterium]|nr:YfhO family protein [Bacteroidia bacterium]